MENKICHITAVEAKKVLKENRNNPLIHIVELQGESIQSWEDYITAIERDFRFPTTCINTMDGYNDWITDLSWLEKEGYILIIHDYRSFLRENLLLREKLISRLRDTVLPFWQEGVERYVVGGKAKPFNVYLVD